MTEPPAHWNLMPEVERVHARAIEEERKHIASLNDGESFLVRFVMVKGKLKARVEPKHIEIA